LNRQCSCAPTNHPTYLKSVGFTNGHRQQARWRQRRNLGQKTSRTSPAITLPSGCGRADDDQEAIVGMLGLEHVGDRSLTGVPVPDFIDTTAPTARFNWVAVAPERQRRGSGRLLSQTAIDRARDHGYRAIILEPQPSKGPPSPFTSRWASPRRVGR
jgi:ribosomal protein S18 acetylase RimI-like enzyme